VRRCREPLRKAAIDATLRASALRRASRRDRRSSTPANRDHATNLALYSQESCRAFETLPETQFLISWVHGRQGPRFIRRITVIGCHSGIPANPIGMSGPRYNTAGIETSPFCPFVLSLRGMMVACVHAMGRIKKTLRLRFPAFLFSTPSNSCRRSLGRPRKRPPAE
jgi:hypothetical protein